MNFQSPALLLDICQGEFRTKRGRAPNRHTGNPLDKCKGTKKTSGRSVAQTTSRKSEQEKRIILDI